MSSFEFEDETIIDDVDYTYDLTPYNFNMDVEGLLRRFADKDILIPSFQRNYVWTKEGASMFIDSVLRGLPTPSLFFYEESNKKYLVIDGQQRLLTLYYFIRGVFPDKKQHQNITVSPTSADIDFSQIDSEEGDVKGVSFTLTGSKICSGWKDKTYAQLSKEEQKRIRNTYIYIIDLKQTSPSDNNSSMYLVYERINTGSTRLNPQQIRMCVSHGSYIRYICNKAVDEKWKTVFGIDDKSSGVSELILRFISLYYTQGTFKGSIKNFLDKSLKENREFQLHSQDEISVLFDKSFFVMTELFNAKSFTPKKSFNGYMMLVTWISIANIVSSIDNYQEWFDSHKELLAQQYKSVLANETVKDFISNTRRSANSQTLCKIIQTITMILRETHA